MVKKCLKVIKDFYEKDLKEGEVHDYFEGKLKVINLDYKNQYGEFILCEYVFEEYEVKDSDDKWIEKHGVKPNKNNPYEIVGAIHIPGYRNLLGGIGFFVKNKLLNEVIGMSYTQAWNLILNEGTVNAEASASSCGNFYTRLISTIEDLPELDSHYWKINAFDEKGKPYSTFTKEAVKELKKSYQHTIRNRVSNQIKQLPFSNSKINTQDIEKLKNMITESEKIVVLTGAGISTMSGIPDYRSAAEGLWMKNPSVLNDLNQMTFEKDAKQFWNSFYLLLKETFSSIMPFPIHDALLVTIKAISPNEGHKFCSLLKSNYNKDVTIITQNVDGLHQKAGSQNVIEMHGNIHECTCPNCKESYVLTEILKENSIPLCERCTVPLRPNVVFYGDQVMNYNKALNKVGEADLIIIAGTTLQVYPFNQLVNYNKNAKTVLINGGPKVGDEINFDLELYGNISGITRVVMKEEGK